MVAGKCMELSVGELAVEGEVCQSKFEGKIIIPKFTEKALILNSQLQIQGLQSRILCNLAYKTFSWKIWHIPNRPNATSIFRFRRNYNFLTWIKILGFPGVYASVNAAKPWIELEMIGMKSF